MARPLVCAPPSCGPARRLHSSGAPARDVLAALDDCVAMYEEMGGDYQSTVQRMADIALAAPNSNSTAEGVGPRHASGAPSAAMVGPMG